jgi:hypothetical protein
MPQQLHFDGRKQAVVARDTLVKGGQLFGMMSQLHDTKPLSILACPNFGRISPPRWPHFVQKNFGSMSDSRTSSAQQSALTSM